MSQRRKFSVYIMSRRVETTPVFKIGSRQHSEDLDGLIIESAHQTGAWTSIVEKMHDPDCEIDPTDTEAHVDCMLWPEMRSYKYYLEQKAAFEIDPDEGPGRFQMVYQNDPRGDDSRNFTKEMIRACFAKKMTLGLPRVGPTSGTPIAPRGLSERQATNLGLIGGIDPTVSGFQGTVIWAYSQNEFDDDPRLWDQWLVDLDNKQGGGMKGIVNAIRWGHQTYGVHEWVVENNSWQKAILAEEEELLRYCEKNGILIHGHQTLYNKNDDYYGVTAMVKLFESGVIHLPTGSNEAYAKAKILERQLTSWDGKRSGKGNIADLVMAMWFPISFIRMRAQPSRVNPTTYDDETEYMFNDVALDMIADDALSAML